MLLVKENLGRYSEVRMTNKTNSDTCKLYDIDITYHSLFVFIQNIATIRPGRQLVPFSVAVKGRSPSRNQY